MKKLYMAGEASEAELLKGLLERQGIECVIRNEAVLNTVSPLAGCYPEIWIMQDEDFSAGNQILQDWQNVPAEEEKTWTCPECKEVISDSFDSCWRCAGKDPVLAESFADNEEA